MPGADLQLRRRTPRDPHREARPAPAGPRSGPAGRARPANQRGAPPGAHRRKDAHQRVRRLAPGWRNSGSSPPRPFVVGSDHLLAGPGHPGRRQWTQITSKDSPGTVDAEVSDVRSVREGAGATAVSRRCRRRPGDRPTGGRWRTRLGGRPGRPGYPGARARWGRFPPVRPGPPPGPRARRHRAPASRQFSRRPGSGTAASRRRRAAGLRCGTPDPCGGPPARRPDRAP